MVKNPQYEEIRQREKQPVWYAKRYPQDATADEKKAKINEFRSKMRELLHRMPPQTTINLKPGLMIFAMNLDEVYRGNNMVSTEFMTADQPTDLTYNITESEVTSGLHRLFRPEHVDRIAANIIRFSTFSSADRVQEIYL